MSGYVYFISDGAAVKIGIAANPQQRLGELQTGNGKRLVLLHAIESNNSRRLEGELHRRFAPNRLAGEWFNLSDSDMQDMRHTRRVDFKKEVVSKTTPQPVKKPVPANAKIGTYKSKGIEYLRYWWREKGSRKVHVAYISSADNQQVQP
jgi:hypothetical protein